MPAALICRDLVKFFADQRILDGVDLTANPGQRLGLIGENGTGKSTLLRLLAGTDTPDAGTITRPADTELLHQELPHPGDQTLNDVLDHALREPRDLLAELDRLTTALPGAPELLDTYGDTLARAEHIAAWDAARRAEETLLGLGLHTITPDRPLATLSGGQRSRIGLAALLIRQPEALLLDEPTNHLDDQALDYLETRLRHHPGVVVAASHDRVFLDRVCTHLIDIDPAAGGLTRYHGAYTHYLATKKAARITWEQDYAAQQDQIDALRQAIDTTARQVAHNRPPSDGDGFIYHFKGGRVQASIAARVRNARQRLAAIEKDPVPKPPAPLHFTPPPITTGDTSGQLLTLRDAHIPGRLHLDRLDLQHNTRLLVTGPNGAGKSTLLAVLKGHLTLPRGHLHHRPGLRIGLLTQDDHWPHPGRTPRQLYPEHATPLHDLGLLPGKDLDRPVAHLSVGQRRRLALALQLADPPHLLLLDEPTNHLSLTLADELEHALGTAPGAVVIASHDRWLRRHWQADQLHLTPTN